MKNFKEIDFTFGTSGFSTMTVPPLFAGFNSIWLNLLLNSSSTKLCGRFILSLGWDCCDCRRLLLSLLLFTVDLPLPPRLFLVDWRFRPRFLPLDRPFLPRLRLAERCEDTNRWICRDLKFYFIYVRKQTSKAEIILITSLLDVTGSIAPDRESIWLNKRTTHYYRLTDSHLYKIKFSLKRKIIKNEIVSYLQDVWHT